MGVKTIIIIIVAGILIIGCAGLPETTRTGAIHDIRIEKTLSNQNLAVNIGDEIRWVNYRIEPVTIEFVPEGKGSFSCEKGFSDMFGKLKLSSRLGPSEAASLCFSKNGEYKYNVRMTASVPGGEIIVSGVIQVGDVQK